MSSLKSRTSLPPFFLLLLLPFFAHSSTSFREGNNEVLYSSSPSYQGWTPLQLNAEGPSARVFAGVSQNAPIPPPYAPNDRSGIAFFGGTTNPTTYEICFNDLWVLNAQDNSTDGRAWTEIPISSNSKIPEPRALTAIAVDNTGTVYLYGGYNGSVWFKDFWQLDITSVIHYPGTGATGQWHLVHAGGSYGPPPDDGLCGQSFMWSGDTYIYNYVLIMFGGGNDKRQLYNKVWNWGEYTYSTGWNSYDGNPPKWPTAREWHAAWLGKENQMHIYGGYDYGYSYLNDTWRLVLDGNQGVTFFSVPTQSAPTPRSNMAVAYSPSRDVAVIWGGREGTTVLGEVWAFSGSDDNWSEVNSTTTSTSGSTLVPRFGMGYGYYEAGDGLIIFGGADAEGNIYNDLWFYPFTNLD